MKKNNALNDLRFLIGNWNVKIYNTSFLDSPSESMAGKATFEWFENKTFIIMRSETAGNGPPTSLSVLNQDDTNGQGVMIYYDSRGVSRIYNMHFVDNIWKLWRNAPGFDQKFEGVVSNDQHIIEASWYRMEDDKNWIRDFNIRYQKISETDEAKPLS